MTENTNDNDESADDGSVGQMIQELQTRLDDKIEDREAQHADAEWPDDEERHQQVLTGLRTARQTVESVIEEYTDVRRPKTLDEWSTHAVGWTLSSNTCNCPACANEAEDWCEMCAGKCNNVDPRCGQYDPEEHGIPTVE